jgi:hypothetical protein
MGIKEVRETIAQLDGAEFCSYDLFKASSQMDSNLHSYLGKLEGYGEINRIGRCTRPGGRNSFALFIPVVKQEIKSQFEPWKAVWPEFFTIPKFTGTSHIYQQEL